ncbi:MAG: serine hydrolase domain-containing protein [Acidobacteriota bacterium]
MSISTLSQQLRAILPVACLLISATLVGASSADAQPLTEKQIARIETYVRSELDGNVVGYQFALAQSGTLLHTHSYGMSNLSQGQVMDSSLQINIGSISKLIPTITALWYAERGLIDLDAPFVNYLDEATFTDVHPSIQDITVRELATYTARLPQTSGSSGRSNCKDDCPELLQKPRGLENCRVTLDISDSPFPYQCARAYQNAGFYLLRLALQGIMASPSRVETVEDWVTEIRDAWLGPSGLEMTCDPDPNGDMRYYTSCDSAAYHSDFCLNEELEGDCECLDGFFFENRALSQSSYCSSGGWRASATTLVRMLEYLREGHILNPEMTAYLLDTSLQDVYGTSGSVGWDRPWGRDGASNLGKNGGFPQMLVTYASLLPSEASAAILINTDDNSWRPAPDKSTDPTTVLRAAWANRGPGGPGDIEGP